MKTIECICYLIDKKLEDLDIKQTQEEAMLLLIVCEIESVRQAIIDDETEISKTHCMVNMCSGDSFLIKKPYQEIADIIKARFATPICKR